MIASECNSVSSKESPKGQKVTACKDEKTSQVGGMCQTTELRQASLAGFLKKCLDGWIIQPDTVSSHGVDVLVGRIQRGKTVTQAADQGVQGLV